jgi:hypothetical protein
LQRFDVQPGFFMTDLYREALVGIAASFSVLQRRTGNSGCVDAIWTFSPGPAGVGGAL